jgi:hypothetical protein
MICRALYALLWAGWQDIRMIYVENSRSSYMGAAVLRGSVDRVMSSGTSDQISDLNEHLEETPGQARSMARVARPTRHLMLVSTTLSFEVQSRPTGASRSKCAFALRRAKQPRLDLKASKLVPGPEGATNDSP